VIQTTYRSVLVLLKLSQGNDGLWMGECTLKYPNSSVVTLGPIEGSQTRDLAKDQALEQARAHIDNHPLASAHTGSTR
jgi:hypothetical protein